MSAFSKREDGLRSLLCRAGRKGLPWTSQRRGTGPDSTMSSNTLFSVLMSFMLQTLFILLISFCNDSCSFSIPLSEMMTHMSSVCFLCWEIKPDQWTVHQPRSLCRKPASACKQQTQYFTFRVGEQDGTVSPPMLIKPRSNQNSGKSAPKMLMNVCSRSLGYVSAEFLEMNADSAGGCH